MHIGKLVFAQLMDWIHPEQFRRCVRRYQGDYRLRHFSCWDQFLCMAFAQLTYRDGLRGVVDCLGSRPAQLYHMGFRGHISRSTLADANESRDWRIYADLAQQLIRYARHLYLDDPLEVDLAETVYALDSTTIDLCLTLFPWARFRQTKAAIKLHTLLDLRGPIPTFIDISEGKMADVRVLDELILEAGSYYVMDRGYLDFQRLYCFVLASAFYVIRTKSNVQLNRLESQPVDRSTGVRCDQIVWLRNTKSIHHYPDTFRRIRYFDAKTKKSLVFLTNNLELPALSIALLYKSRWQVELASKWIKQHLRIKHFFGTSDNAVKTQVWISMCVYVIGAIARKELRLEMSLYTMLQILSVNVLSDQPLYQLFTQARLQNATNERSNQLMLWDF